MKNPTIAVLAGILVVAAGCKTQTTSQENKMNTSQKDQVVALLNSIESGDHAPAAAINPHKYIQHNLAVGDGVAAFGAVLAQLPPGSAKVKVVRAFADGDYVFTHTEYNFFGPKAGFDIFRFENGLIVEHWDNLQEIATTTASGRTQFDGATEIKDRDKTAANKALVGNFVKDVLMGAAPHKITEYVSTEHYAQHNPAVKDGLAGLGEALKGLAAAGMPLVVEKNHLILGEGNFVLTVSEGQFMKKHVAFYDLFRIEGGKIVEHWDTIETIPEKSAWKNPNGKF